MIRQYHYEVVDSTNLQARRLCKEEGLEGEPFAVTADEQSAGQGRGGREWKSPKGGLWMTVAWPAVCPLDAYTALPLAIGRAVTSCLDDLYTLSCRLKWPNDVLANGRKLAGILCQTATSPSPPLLLIGMGLNGNYKAASLGGDTRLPATSLADELGRSVNLGELRTALLGRLEETLVLFEREGLAPLLPEIRSRLAWIGESVSRRTSEGTETPAGRIQGIDEQGRLLLQTGHGPRAFACGELQQLVKGSHPSENTITYLET